MAWASSPQVGTAGCQRARGGVGAAPGEGGVGAAGAAGAAGAEGGQKRIQEAEAEKTMLELGGWL